MPSGSDSLGATRHPLSPFPRCQSALKAGPADGGAEAGPKPASAPTGKARRLRGGDAAADRKTRTDGTN